jgi:hypothetical protein
MDKIYAPNLPYGTLLAGHYPTPEHFPIYEWGRDGQHFVIFGMNATASVLTDHGKQLYINALHYMAPLYEFDLDGDSDGDDSIIDQILDTLSDPANAWGIGTASGLAMLIGVLLGIIALKGKKKG